MRLFLTEKRDINEHEAAIALLRFAVKAVHGIELPEMAREPSGKPYFPARRDIFFSLSHSKHHVLCAIADAPVGCDCEEHKPVTERLMRRVCSEKELEKLDFFDLWVLKESFIKLKGTLSMEYRDMCFFPSEDGILTPGEGVNARLYRDVDGLSVGVCSAGDCAEKLEVISFGKVFSGY